MPANPIAVASFSSATYAYNALLSSGDGVNSKAGTVASGIGVLVRGTIVNWDPATSAITVPTTVAGCNAILVNDIDATAAIANAEVYTTGSFKADAITWPGALSHALVTDQLRDYGIYLQSVIYTDGTLVKSAPTQAEEDTARKHLEENKAAAEKAAKAVKEQVKEEEAKASDSIYPYLTPDEREKHPELANPPVESENPSGGKGVVGPQTESKASEHATEHRPPTRK